MSLDSIRMAAYVVLTIVGLGTGWSVRGWKEGYDSNMRAEARAEKEAFARELLAGISKDTLEAINSIRIENTTIYQRAVHEVQTNTVYRDCRVPAAGVQLINDARTGSD